MLRVNYLVVVYDLGLMNKVYWGLYSAHCVFISKLCIKTIFKEKEFFVHILC